MRAVRQRDDRLVVLGLELGDGLLIEKLAHRGELPHFARLLREGTSARLSTPADLLHVTALPSLYTGTTPGEHGVYFTHQPAPGLQGYRRFSPGQYGRPTFWKLLDDSGVRCAVLDAPYSHVEEGFNGAYINDWGNWARYLETTSAPSALLGRFKRACGDYPLGLEAHQLGLRALAPGATATRLIRSIQAKSAAIRWLGTDQDPSLLFSVFGETHVAGHYCYSADEGYPPALEVYRALDEAIGEIAEWAGPRTTLVVISGDRPVANHAGWHLLPEVLQSLGLLSTTETPSVTKGASSGRRFKHPIKFLRDVLPKDARKRMADWLPQSVRDRLAQQVDMAGIDWARTKVYCLPTDLEGCLRINLRGREPEGIIDSGEAYDRLIEQLTGDLLGLVEPDTGQRVVRDVLDSRIEFPGSRQPYLPDLVVRWNGSAPIEAVTSPSTGEIRIPSPDPRPGSHAGPGFMMACGPGIPVGRRLEQAMVLDLAPTLLARFGVRPPKHMTGTVWHELAGAI